MGKSSQPQYQLLPMVQHLTSSNTHNSVNHHPTNMMVSKPRLASAPLAPAVAQMMHHSTSTTAPSSTKSSGHQRKDNSLSYLCERFCTLIKSRNGPISIDEVADKLNVQRRRMYEILNIMSSVGLVERVRTGSYTWKGFENMVAKLRKLKDKGIPEAGTGPNDASVKEMGSASHSKLGGKKKAVATCLSERFIQIFVCNEFHQPIVLEDISSVFNEYFGTSSTSSTSSTTNNTSNSVSRGRRMYDIANVFCTLKLVKKSLALDTATKKKRRLYTWCGPNLNAPETWKRKFDQHVLGENNTKNTNNPATTKRLKTLGEASSHVTPSLSLSSSLPAPIIGQRFSAAYRAPLKPISSNTASTSVHQSNPSNRRQATHASSFQTPSGSSSSTTGSGQHSWFDQMDKCDTADEPPIWLDGEDSYTNPSVKPIIMSLSNQGQSGASEMESMFALRAEVHRLARALDQSTSRETELKTKVEQQSQCIRKLLLAQKTSQNTKTQPLSNQTTTTFLINSPITNLVFTPNSRPKMLHARMKPRCGPALPNLESEEALSSQGSNASTPKDDSRLEQHQLLASAATSLLSLTPNKHHHHAQVDDAAVYSSLALSGLEDYRSSGSAQPPGLSPRVPNTAIFDTLSPLSSTRVWEEDFQ